MNLTQAVQFLFGLVAEMPLKEADGRLRDQAKEVVLTALQNGQKAAEEVKALSARLAELDPPAKPEESQE